MRWRGREGLSEGQSQMITPGRGREAGALLVLLYARVRLWAGLGVTRAQVQSRATNLLSKADAAVDELSDLLEVLLLEAARGERGRADADTTRDEGGLVAGHGVLVERDGRELEHRLDARAVDARRLEVDKEEVVLASAAS